MAGAIRAFLDRALDMTGAQASGADPDVYGRAVDNRAYPLQIWSPDAFGADM
jgi:hypothetical protein